jgi:hypothetical protein
LFAAWWPHFSESELPLVGLRNLSSPLIGWPLTLITFGMAFFLSFPDFLSRERLLVCAGFSFCLFVVVAFYASPVAAGIFVLIGAYLVRESRSHGKVPKGAAVEK